MTAPLPHAGPSWPDWPLCRLSQGSASSRRPRPRRPHQVPLPRRTGRPATSGRPSCWSTARSPTHPAGPVGAAPAERLLPGGRGGQSPARLGRAAI
jgi:hypothetical protein